MHVDRKPDLVDDVWEHPVEVSGKLHLVDIAKHEPLKLRIQMQIARMILDNV